MTNINEGQIADRMKGRMTDRTEGQITDRTEGQITDSWALKMFSRPRDHIRL